MIKFLTALLALGLLIVLIGLVLLIACYPVVLFKILFMAMLFCMFVAGWQEIYKLIRQK